MTSLFARSRGGDLSQIEANLAECDALEAVLAEYVVTEATRHPGRQRGGPGRVHGKDMVVWSAVLPAIGFGAARRGVVTHDTAESFLAYTRDLDPHRLKWLVRSLFKLGSHQAASLPPAA